MHTEALYDTLNSVTAIPIVPYRDGAIDLGGHRRNIQYLMENNHLDGNRMRVIGIAGTSLIHHFSFEDQMRVIAATGEEMGEDGFLMSGIVPNPFSQAEELVRRQSALSRPPDIYLIMPLTGVADHEATYDDYMAFAERLGTDCGACFLLYMRSADYVNPIIRLVKDSPHMVGVKVGTSEEENHPAHRRHRRRRHRHVGDRRPEHPGRRTGRPGAHLGHGHRRHPFGRRDQQRPAPGRLRGLGRRRSRHCRPRTPAFHERPAVQLLGGGGSDDHRGLGRRCGGRGRSLQSASIRVPRDIAGRVAEAVEPMREYH